MQHSQTPVLLSAIFHALSDDNRREMVVRLATGRLSVSELAEPLGLRLPAAVKHLALLEQSGLVVSQKHGRVRSYCIQPSAFSSISQWIAERDVAINAAFDRLEQAIAEFPEDIA